MSDVRTMAVAWLAVLALIGCDSETEDDGGVRVDAARRDAGRAVDAARADTGTPPIDAGGTPDAGPPPNALRGICPATLANTDPFMGVDSRAASRIDGDLTFPGGGVFLEGPVWVASRNTLYFSNMNMSDNNDVGVPPARIHSYVPGGAFDVALDGSWSNGLALLPNGDLALAHHGESANAQAIRRWTIGSTSTERIVGNADGARFNSPNDIAVREDGHLYVSDPRWQLGRRPEGAAMAVYHVRPDATFEAVAMNLDYPNGVSLAPDGRTLYWGERNGRISRIAIGADGEPSGTREDFGNVSGPDGMTVDCAGNLYVTSGSRVVVLDGADGDRVRGEITGLSGATNVAFGGADRRTLFITGRSNVFSIELAVPGYPF